MSRETRHKVKITDGTEECTGAQEQTAPVDEPQAEEAAEQGLDELTVLRETLQAESRRADEEHERCLRALADFANYRRRQEEMRSSLKSLATRELILKLLAVVDDFERALASSDKTQSFDALHDGLQLTLKKIAGVLEAEGVQPIEAVGQEFNPELHEAVMRVEDGEHPDNTVVHELQKGYTQAGDVIRPARVTVAVSPED